MQKILQSVFLEQEAILASFFFVTDLMTRILKINYAVSFGILLTLS